MTYSEVLRFGKEYLEKAKILEADLNAWYLLQYIMEKQDVEENSINKDERGTPDVLNSTCSFTRAYYYSISNETFPEERKEEYIEVLKKRSTHIPLEYITNSTEFMGYEFYVDENCLIPRQDTEILVEEVLKNSHGTKVIDMCSGSGCIGISIYKMSGLEEVSFCDISPEALEVTKKNAKKHGVNAKYFLGDLWENITGKYDIIVSNPPYIPTADIDGLMPEVAWYEPILALDGGHDGLRIYERLIRDGVSHLRENGLMALEIGYDEGQVVSRMMLENGLKNVSIIKDLAGLDRVVLGFMNER